MSSKQPGRAQRAPSRPCDIIRAFRIPAPVLALAVMCFFMATPAQAADKAQVQTPAPAKIAPNPNPAGESIVKGILDRGAASEKNNVAVLSPLAGEWNCMISFWAEPVGTPQQSTATATNEMILDGRFLSTSVMGSLNVGGHLMPWKGQGLIGYDNARQSFTSTWVDTMTTGVMIGAGTYDAKNRVIAENGHFTNPLTGAEDHFRSELKFVDESNYTLTTFALDKAGKQSKLIEIDYSRKTQ